MSNVPKSQWSKDSAKTGTESCKYSQLGPAPPRSTSLPNETLDRLLEPKIILYSKIDRRHRWARRQLLRPGRQQRLCLDRSSRHLASGRGEGRGAEAARWLVRMVPTRGLFCTLTGDRAPAGGLAPPCRPTSVLGSSAHSPLSSARACARSADLLGPARPGPSASALVSPGFPGTRGPRPGFGEGHAYTAWPEPLSGQLGLSLACLVFALSQGYFAVGQEFASAFFTRNGPCKSLFE